MYTQSRFDLYHNRTGRPRSLAKLRARPTRIDDSGLYDGVNTVGAINHVRRIGETIREVNGSVLRAQSQTFHRRVREQHGRQIRAMYPVGVLTVQADTGFAIRTTNQR